MADTDQQVIHLKLIASRDVWGILTLIVRRECSYRIFIQDASLRSAFSEGHRILHV